MSMSNALLRSMDTAGNRVWQRIIRKHLQRNVAVTKTPHLAFKYNREYYTDSPMSVSTARTHSQPLHPSLHEDFENDYEVYRTRFEIEKSRLRHYFRAIFTKALSREELLELLPQAFIPVASEMEFTPIKSAKGLTPDEKQELLEKYQPTISAINAYFASEKLT